MPLAEMFVSSILEFGGLSEDILCRFVPGGQGRYYWCFDRDADVCFRVRKFGNDGRASKNICSKVPSHLVANENCSCVGNIQHIASFLGINGICKAIA